MRPWFLLLLAACGGFSAPQASTAVTAQLPLGCEVALVSIDDHQFVFDRATVSVLRDGAVAVRAGAPMVGGQVAPWDAAAAIDGPDGVRWAVGLAEGALWRVTEGGQIEAVSDRLGIGRTRVSALAGSGGTFVLALENGVAASRDSVHLERFTSGPARHVAAAAGTIAVARASEVEVFDLAARARRTYPLRGARAIAFTSIDSIPRLVVATEGELYIERDAELRRVASPPPRSLVSSGDQLWLLARDGLYLLERGSLARTPVAVVAATRVFASDRGAAWVAGSGTLTRHARSREDDWSSVVRPVFERGCAACHGPRGSAGLDLSTPTSWTLRRHRLQRVLQGGQMPPPSHPIVETDRVTLLTWLAN